jgi:hypothetical protein
LHSFTEPLARGIVFQVDQAELAHQILFGTKDNAVKTQVWMTVCVYVRVAIRRKEFGLELSRSQILQVLSVNVFEQVPLVELVAKPASQNKAPRSGNQLIFNTS